VKTTGHAIPESISMDYRYTTVHRVKGVTFGPDKIDIDLLNDDSAGLRAYLTTRLDVHSNEIDEHVAIANVLLNSMFGHSPNSLEQLSTEVTSIQEARRKKYGESVFLVTVVQGVVQPFQPDAEREFDGFIVYLDGSPNKQIRDKLTERVSQVVASLSFAIDNLLAVEKVTDTVIFYREDGKRVHSYNLTGSANAFGSRRISDDDPPKVDGYYRSLRRNPALQQMTHLISSSLSTSDDQLRSFLTIWSAFEMFISKVFSDYERQLLQDLEAAQNPHLPKQYLVRIKDVMNGRVRLTDKFSVISDRLDPVNAQTDVAEFAKLKKQRDTLHTKDISLEHLPIEATQRLVRKYVALHLRRQKSPASSS